MKRFILPLILCFLIPTVIFAVGKGRYQRPGGLDVPSGGDLAVKGGGDIVAYSSGDIKLDSAGTGAFKLGGYAIYDCDEVTVSSAELLALNATPKTLVAAPGANKFVVLHNLTCSLDYGTAAYAGVGATEDFTIAYTDGSGADALPPIETTGFIDQTNDETRVTFATGTVVAAGAATAPVIPVSNAAVVLSLDVGEVITGDGTLDCYVCYAVLPDLL